VGNDLPVSSDLSGAGSAFIRLVDGKAPGRGGVTKIEGVR
jgi:hypothetical protein